MAQLKLRLADPNIEGMFPDLADMVRLVEESIGLSSENMTVKWDTLDIIDHKAKLPADFYSLCDIIQWGGHTMNKDRYDNLIFGQLTSIDTGIASWWNPTWEKHFIPDYSVEGCWLKSPQRSGKVKIIYYSIPVDSEGIPMIKQGHEQAFMSYVIWIRQQTKYMSGQIQRYEVNACWQEFEQQCLYARAKDGNPSRRRLGIAASINNDSFRALRNYGRGVSRWWGGSY